MISRYLASNKIEDMKNVATLPNLRILDLGYNHIRKIEGVSGLKNLRQLYLGRNKIECISVYRIEINMIYRGWRIFQ